MTVFELHLQVNQRLQEVASYKRDKFKSEEIDMALNKAMFRLLEKGVNSKFQDSDIDLSKVAALIQKNKVQELIIPSSSDSLYEDNMTDLYAVLPPDFYWLINNRVEVLTDPVNCGVAPSLATTTITEYVAKVAWPALSVSSPYFAATSVSSSTLGSLYSSPSEITAGFNSSNSKYVVVNNIIEALYRTGQVRAYWERYRDVYTKNTLILVSNVQTGTITITSSAMTSNAVAIATPYTIYNRALIPAITNKTIEITSTKNTSGADLYQVLKQNKFYASSSEEPIINQTEDYLIFYGGESFLITRSYSDYIRKPRTISLALNQSCELSDATHPKVIDLTIEILRLDTKDQSYGATVQDTQVRTN